MAVQTFKISELAAAVANPDTDHVEISRDNGNGTFSSFKAPAGGGGGVAVGQALLQIAGQPLDPDYLRLDGAAHPKASYPEIADFFPTASDWGLGADEDITTPAAANNVGAIALSNDASKLYISETGSGTVKVYDTSTWSILTTITINNGWTSAFTPRGMEVSRNGEYITLSVETSSQSSTEVALLSTSTDSVVSYIPDSLVVFDDSASFSFDSNLIIYRSGSNINAFNVYDISLSSIVQTTDMGGDVRSTCFKNDDDSRIVLYDTGATKSYSIVNASGSIILGPVDASNARGTLTSTSRTSDYFYTLDIINDLLIKVSTSDLTTIDSIPVVNPFGISESGSGEYIAVSSDDPSRNYFFVIRDSDLTTVSGFPSAPSTSYSCSISNNDAKLAFGYQSGDFFTVANQLGSLDDFIISDVASPDPTFEYRIKAK